MPNRYRHAIITGGSGLLGFNLAKDLISRGMVDNLSMCSRSKIEEEELNSLAEPHGTKLHFYYFDLQDSSMLQFFIGSCFQTERVDLLILNAGVSLSKSAFNAAPGASSPFYLEDEFEIERAFATNAQSPALAVFHAVKAFMQYDREKGHRMQIAAISSLASLAPMTSPLYSATKSALNMYILSLARQYRDHGIDFTLVLPGFIKTAMSDRFVGRKPGMMSAGEAARIINDGLLRKKYIIAFPWYLYIGLRILNALPYFMQDYFLRSFAYEVMPDRSRKDYDEELGSTRDKGK